MTTTDLPAATAVEPTPPRPLTGWRAAVAEAGIVVGSSLRLVWRHWPVLLALALAGTIGRELLLVAALKATDFGGLAGMLVFLFTPLSLMVAMVLMLRTVRPSLPRLGVTESGPVLNHVGAVAIPFIFFYLYSGYLDYDFSRFNHAIVWNKVMFSGQNESWRYPAAGAAVAVVAGLALLLRWLLNRYDVVRRRPVLGLPAAYLEFVWIMAAFLLVRDLSPAAYRWRDRTVAWQEMLAVWHGDFAVLGPAAQAAQVARDWLNVLWSSSFAVIVVPVAALVSGAVVLAASIRSVARPVPSRVWWRRTLRVTGYAGSPYGRIANLTRLVATMRLVLRSGVLPMMVFCLAFVAIGTVDELLNEPERLLIGSQSVTKVWAVLFYPLQWFNQAIGLVLLMCLIAAAVDRSPIGSAHRQPGVPRQLEVVHDPDRARPHI